MCIVITELIKSISNSMELHAEIGKKNKQNLSNILRPNFSFLKIIRFLHPCYHPKIVRHILKNVQKNKCVCFNETV